MDLPECRFDGIFANAALCHVCRQELSRVLRRLWESLRPSSVLFCSNPWGIDEQGWSGDRYGCFTHPGIWSEYVTAAYGLLQHLKKAPAILVTVVES